MKVTDFLKIATMAGGARCESHGAHRAARRRDAQDGRGGAGDAPPRLLHLGCISAMHLGFISACTSAETGQAMRVTRAMHMSSKEAREEQIKQLQDGSAARVLVTRNSQAATRGSCLATCALHLAPAS